MKDAHKDADLVDELNDDMKTAEAVLSDSGDFKSDAWPRLKNLRGFFARVLVYLNTIILSLCRGENQRISHHKTLVDSLERSRTKIQELESLTMEMSRLQVLQVRHLDWLHDWARWTKDIAMNINRCFRFICKRQVWNFPTRQTFGKSRSEKLRRRKRNSESSGCNKPSQLRKRSRSDDQKNSSSDGVSSESNDHEQDQVVPSSSNEPQVFRMTEAFESLRSMDCTDSEDSEDSMESTMTDYWQRQLDADMFKHTQRRRTYIQIPSCLHYMVDCKKCSGMHIDLDKMNNVQDQIVRLKSNNPGFRMKHCFQDYKFLEDDSDYSDSELNRYTDDTIWSSSRRTNQTVGNCSDWSMPEADGSSDSTNCDLPYVSDSDSESVPELESYSPTNSELETAEREAHDQCSDNWLRQNYHKLHLGRAHSVPKLINNKKRRFDVELDYIGWHTYIFTRQAVNGDLVKVKYLPLRLTPKMRNLLDRGYNMYYFNEEWYGQWFQEKRVHEINDLDETHSDSDLP